MKFKLSQETLNLINKPSSYKLTKQQANYYNRVEFYKKRPDLAPRDVYLREGRMMNMKEVKKIINNFGATPYEKICNWFKDIYNTFKMLFTS